jgi:dTDP-4-dehydrorhamnose reductase
MARYPSFAGDRLIEYWASPEPTIARITADTVRDQLDETGVAARIDDVDRIVALEVAATRLPVLWERAAPCHPGDRSFAWAQERASRLVALGVRPIATLLHHGSGPHYTDLLDDAFPALFADYAEAAARALPYVVDFTPINEVLTTARFTTLYGAWYPNVNDDRAFGRALVNQAHATQLAMERIRHVTPNARLVTTEDLQGFTAADAGTEPYVAFLRERRWLALDLIEGRVDAAHPLAAWLRDAAGVSEERLAVLRAHATPIAVAGFNHYPHSERHLFTRADGTLGDVPAVYVEGATDLRCRPLLREAADRFAAVALSEVHVNAVAGERVSWLLEHDADARALAAEGANVVAVGAWAAFGMVDWHSLLRRRDGVAEDGIYTFVGRDGVPQETPVAEALRALALGDDAAAHALAEPGWWTRASRYRTPEELAAMGDAGIAEGEHVRPRSEARV